MRYSKILLPAFLFLLTGCAKESETVHALPAGECRESVFFDMSGSVAESGQGYYAEDPIQGHLTFISKDTHEQTVLCGKPECPHFGGSRMLETCNANLGKCIPASLVAGDNCLYVLKYDEITYDVTLMRVSMDGQTKEELFTVGQAPDAGGYFSYVISGDSVYLSSYVPSTRQESPESSLQMFSLDGKTKETIYSGAYITSLKSCHNKIYFLGDAGGNLCLYAYDLQTKSTELLAENTNTYTINGPAKTLYYYRIEDGLYRMDIETGKKELLRKSDADTRSVRLACDGQYLYMDNYTNEMTYKTEDEEKHYFLFICDLNGTVVNQIEDNNELQWPLGGSCGGEFLLKIVGSPGLSYAYIDKADITTAKEWTILNEK